MVWPMMVCVSLTKPARLSLGSVQTTVSWAAMSAKVWMNNAMPSTVREAGALLTAKLSPWVRVRNGWTVQVWWIIRTII